MIFAFHGYVRIIHDLIHGRPQPARFHIRGYKEEGTTTTPFDMVVLNEMSRYHLAMEAVKRTNNKPIGSDEFIHCCVNKLTEHKVYIEERLDDLPEINDWKWQRI